MGIARKLESGDGESWTENIQVKKRESILGKRKKNIAQFFSGWRD
jgi:hypothetical protein